LSTIAFKENSNKNEIEEEYYLFETLMTGCHNFCLNLLMPSFNIVVNLMISIPRTVIIRSKNLSFVLTIDKYANSFELIRAIFQSLKLFARHL